jgi:agmatinase
MIIPQRNFRSHEGGHVNQENAVTRPRPRDAAVSPRFAQVPTFMRLPLIAKSDELDVAILGVPFDGGVSNRPGARFGPREIRSESVLCRPYNPEVGINPFDHLAIGDTGDVDVNPISIEMTYGRVESRVSELIEKECLPLIIGGDHSISYPVMKTLAKRWGPLALVHIDSHSDLWDDYFGSRFAHGTMFRRALEDGILGKGSVIQIGIRGQLYAEDDEDIAREYGVEIIRIEQALRLGAEELGNRCSRLTGPVYVSVDIDSVDPAFAPGTGTPAVGGFTSLNILQLLRQLHRLRIVGTDIVEVSPPYDVAGTTAYLAANLVFEIMCQLALRARDKC